MSIAELAIRTSALTQRVWLPNLRMNTGTILQSTDSSIALVHDYLLVLRGAERSFAAMADLYPDAPLYTLLYDERGTRERFANRSVTTSFLQRLGIRQEGFRKLLPLYPIAAERLPISGYDVVLSSSSAFAHGVRIGSDSIHVCYCYTPLRYAWFEQERALAEVPRPLRPALRATLARSRRWDRRVSERVTRYVAISKLSAERIARYLQRDAEIVYPPVEIDRFSPSTPEDFFLIVCELVRHKQVDVALEAARRAGKRVVVVGSGPDRERLKQQYADVATFEGRLNDDELARLYPRALAQIVPNVEEFGITAVEAQAAGRPVLAADGGGARETVVDNETGLFFPLGDISATAEAMREVNWTGFDQNRCRKQAEKFSVRVFQEGVVEQLRRAGADVPQLYTDNDV
jgi:glycosyltransferase involved in cell wall biosynthesis